MNGSQSIIDPSYTTSPLNKIFRSLSCKQMLPPVRQLSGIRIPRAFPSWNISCLPLSNCPRNCIHRRRLPGEMRPKKANKKAFVCRTVNQILEKQLELLNSEDGTRCADL
ncbi:hypothetical protein EK904_011001 [Melospiza melodia maxima]|nr:hypothetical protein EK904_011001 [Melospiza melodia maxima]